MYDYVWFVAGDMSVSDEIIIIIIIIIINCLRCILLWCFLQVLAMLNILQQSKCYLSFLYIFTLFHQGFFKHTTWPPEI